MHLETRLPEHLRYVAIEGVIGVGKTSLAKFIQERFTGKLVLEQFEENPFLAQFYSDRARWAFHTQLSFLASRFRQQQELPARDLFHQVVISDYTFDKDRIFARINLNGDELQLYHSLFNIMEPNTPTPDLVVYLQASPDRLMQNIAKRGRSYEQMIERSYIETLVESYNQYFFHYSKSPLLIVNVTHIDFVKHPEELEELISQITNFKQSGTMFFTPAKSEK